MVCFNKRESYFVFIIGMYNVPVIIIIKYINCCFEKLFKIVIQYCFSYMCSVGT